MNESASQLDPFKWKPLLGFVLPLFVVIPLVFLEVQLVREIMAGYTRAWIEACIFGAFLVFMLGLLAMGLWRWWNRPVGEAAIMQAAGTVARLLPDEPLIFHSPPKPSLSKAVYFGAPAACLVMALVGLLLAEWILFWISLGAAAVFGAILGIVYLAEQKGERQALGLDPRRKTVVFENFTFTTRFFPNKPSPREEIPFSGILDCDYYPGHKGGPPTLYVRTIRGRTTVYGRIDGFYTIRALLESLVVLNLADPEQHAANLRAEPKVSVPWQGWLLVAGVFAGLVGFIWLLISLTS